MLMRSTNAMMVVGHSRKCVYEKIAIEFLYRIFENERANAFGHCLFLIFL